MKRPFRGLRATGPARSYEAIVVGSGIGGLCCANLLAKAGVKTLLVEQHYMAGGYCSTFRRAGFTFDAATHFYPLLGNPKTITGKLLADLGVETRWVAMDPVDTFHFPDGRRFEVPADFDTYRRQLDERFPEQRAKLKAFFTAVQETYLLGLLKYFREREVDRIGPWLGMTLGEALERFIDDPELRLLLCADCPHWGSRPGETSFVFDSMLRVSYFLGNYYPVGGSQAFADELARCFEERGGDILMSTRAEGIEVRDGRARGVRLVTTRGPLKGTRTVDCDALVWNGDLRQLVDNQLAEDCVPADYRRQVLDLEPSYPCFLVHVGLRGVSADDLERAQGYYWASWDAERVGADALICKIFAPTLYEPALAPKGGQIVILQKVIDPAAWPREDQAAHKARVEKVMVDQMAAALPGIEDHIVVKLSASARTSWRFTLNEAGAMLGWRMAPEQLGEHRPDLATPVEGLWLTGHWTRPGGGITPVIVSAMRAAEAILAGDDSTRRRNVGGTART